EKDDGVVQHFDSPRAVVRGWAPATWPAQRFACRTVQGKCPVPRRGERDRRAAHSGKIYRCPHRCPPGTWLAVGRGRPTPIGGQARTPRPDQGRSTQEAGKMVSHKLKLLAISAAVVMASGCSVMRGQQTTGAYLDDASVTTRGKSAFA